MSATSPRSACRTSATSWSRPPAARKRWRHCAPGADIDLVFSDVVMPGGMSGFDLAHWMQENARAVPVLLTSGFAEDVARTGEMPAAELEILRKPYTGAELARALRKTLDAAGPRR